MPTEDKMTIDERLKYLRIQHPRYQKANRKERTRLLDEMGKVTGLDRKTLIRSMGRSRNDLVRKPRHKQRGRTYDQRDLLTYLFTLPCTEPGVLADVYATLPADMLSWKGDGTPVTLSIDRITNPR